MHANAFYIYLRVNVNTRVLLKVNVNTRVLVTRVHFLAVRMGFRLLFAPPGSTDDLLLLQRLKVLSRNTL